MALYRPKRVVCGTYSFTKFDAGLIFWRVAWLPQTRKDVGVDAKESWWVEELRTEDTEAYKELMRMNNKTFYEILTAVLAILPLNGFWQNHWPKNYHPLVQTAKTVINYYLDIKSNLNMPKLHDG